MTDKETNTQVRSGDKRCVYSREDRPGHKHPVISGDSDVSIPEMIDKDTSTQ